MVKVINFLFVAVSYIFDFLINFCLFFLSTTFYSAMIIMFQINFTEEYLAMKCKRLPLFTLIIIKQFFH